MGLTPRKHKKLCTLEELVALRSESRLLGEPVVHCHGCFDIVHPGHVRHLEHARQLGKRLVVTVTADEFIQKGNGRPFFSEYLRAENLAALSCVDWVYINPYPTAFELLNKLQPDVYVKGVEYEYNNDPRFTAERDSVESHGGRVVFSSGDVVFSSSKLVEALSKGPQDTSNRVNPSLQKLMQMHTLTYENVNSTIEMMSEKHVLVIGESILDTYVECSQPKVASESPILSLCPIHKQSFLGGSAIIARHIAAMGAKVTLITPLPKNRSDSTFESQLASEGIDVIPINYEGFMHEKERFLCQGKKLFKLDRCVKVEFDHMTRLRLIETACKHAMNADAAVVADYGLGMCGTKLTHDLFSKLRPIVPFLAGDVSGSHSSLSDMHRADWLTPSEHELRSAVSSQSDSLPSMILKLLNQTQAKQIALTMAEDGVVMFENCESQEAPDGQLLQLSSLHIPSLNQSPNDVLGCGDAFLALSTLAHVVGSTPAMALYLGSLAAGVCGGRLGNHPVTMDEIFHLSQQLDKEITRQSQPIPMGHI